MRKISKIAMTLLVFVVGIVGVANAAVQEGAINFNNALELVFENNLDLKIAELTLANSQIDWEKSKLSASAETRSQKLSLSLELEKNQNAYQESRYNIINEMIVDYVDLTKNRQSVEVNELLLKVNELEVARIEELYAQGSANSSELMDARSSLEDQKLTLHKSREDWNKLLDNLQWKTGLEDQVSFDELTFSVETLQFSKEEVLTKVLDTSYDLQDYDIRFQLAELELEKAKLEGKPELELNKLTNSKDIAWYHYLEAKRDLEKKVKDDLWALEIAAKTIEIKSSELKISQENYQQTQVGYQQGFYTETEYLQSQVSLINAQKALFTARADYWLKVYDIYHQTGQDDLIGGEL